MLFPKATRGLDPILHDLLNVLVQNANKIGLQKKKTRNYFYVIIT
jgi:hypothetical protein